MRKLLLLLAFTFSWASLLNAKDESGYPEPDGEAATARQLVEAALAEEDGAALLSAVDQLKALVPSSSPIADELSAGGAATDQELTVPELKQRLQRVAEMLAFVPLGEAKLPEGFPTYTPVGMIEVKRYPKQRMAMAKQFMTLFGHISTNGIAMTAPVQMEYEASAAGRPQQQSMAFFYASPEIGKPGERGAVTVVDREPTEVVALGVRGGVGSQVIEDANARLERWVADQSKYEVSGPLRVMGYNSPMVGRKNQFHEVQLPLKRAATSAAR
ncbi:SOUL heme-binding protein [Posidoniimonas polymericola]|uniref:SOUL heme-binding protein n=1 Tax=Posidoniimonas polymericola TaxID=2528002 RepID=A0A5C5YQ49_9BACT|nr:heme-binding protein [Posidoniimonas polymericola]TWT76890.1 SOUL heme-binding protein [Posidoniimonas polymericola]